MNPAHTNRKLINTQFISGQNDLIFFQIGVCAMSYQKMCEARTADGTDEDLIFIFND